jgi:hypothetical protein
MRTKEETRTAVASQPGLGVSLAGRPERAQPCPERIWWFGVFVGAPLMLTGFMLTLTLIGAPIGIPLWGAGLGLMLTPRPCRD